MLESGSVSSLRSSTDTSKPDSSSLFDSFTKRDSTSVPTSIFRIPASLEISPRRSSVSTEIPRSSTSFSKLASFFSHVTDSGYIAS